MSSRVHQGGSPAEIEPIEWKLAPAGGARRSANLYTGGGKEEREDPSAAGDEDGTQAAGLQREIAARVEESYRRGFQEAQSAAERQAVAEAQGAGVRLAQAIADLATFRPRLRRETEGELVSLAMAVAKRILRREIQMDPEALLGLIKAGLEKVNRADLLRVRIHPDFSGIVENHLNKNSSGTAVTVTADASLERGAAVFETVRGRVDASIDAQLQEIERGFTDLQKR